MILGRACGHIKAFEVLIHIPHQRKICTEDLLGTQATEKLGRTTVLSTYKWHIDFGHDPGCQRWIHHHPNFALSHPLFQESLVA